MERKLVQMGKHTLMTAIPSKWIKRHNLEKGDHVEFTEVENKLVLTSTKEIYERKVEINIISPTLEFIWRVLQPAYLSGYDEVRLNFKDENAMKIIEDSVKNLIGFEITETKKDHIIINSISQNIDSEFENILKRTFFILQNLAEVLMISLEKKDKNILNRIYPLEMTINKYTMFLRRIINRTGYKHPHYMYLIVTYLELTANHIDYIRRYYLIYSKNAIIEEESYKESKKIYLLIKRVHELYYKYNIESFRWISEELPHFKWFSNIKDPEIRFNFKSIAEYLVQISRQVQALHT